MPRAKGTISLGDNASLKRTGSIHIKLAERVWKVNKIPPECTYCCDHNLCNRQRIVWGQGNPKSPLMFVGMSPGKDGSDETGMIFTSSTTQAPFEALLEHLQISRYDIYLTNLVKCRPNAKLVDVRDERVKACWPFLIGEIFTVRPKLIFAFGRLVSNQLCGGHPKFYRENIPNITDSVITDRDTGIRVIPVHHPSWVSYSNDASKLELWLNNIGGIFHVEGSEKVHKGQHGTGLDKY